MNPNGVIMLTDDDFDEFIRQSEIPVLVDFYAPWCGPCRALSPHVDRLAEELSGRLIVAKMNVDENKETPAKYEVMSVPTLLLFKNGQEVLRRVGARTTGLKEQVEDYLG